MRRSHGPRQARIWGEIVRLFLLAVAGVVALTALVVAAPTALAASYPTKHFRVEYGNTYSDGYVTFYNRSVGVTGEQKSVSTTTTGCRYTHAEAFNSQGGKIGEGDSQVTCGKSEKFTIKPFPADVAGGAAYVEVTLVSYEYSDYLDTQRLYPR
jgi:hypothetical protein